jgi:hypothetical protein
MRRCIENFVALRSASLQRTDVPCLGDIASENLAKSIGRSCAFFSAEIVPTVRADPSARVIVERERARRAAPT